METTSPAAVATANWWAEQVGQPAFDNGGDPLAGGLAALLADRHPVKAGAAATFAELLAARIDPSKYTVTLAVDYGPDHVLGDVARQAGISTSRFPWKTTTWTREDHVTASRGYRGRSVLVWASDEWLANRPTCDSQAWDESRHDAEYHGDPFACSLPVHHDSPCVYDRPIVLCAVCGRRDGWYHDSEQRGHRPDFHEFAESARSTQTTERF